MIASFAYTPFTSLPTSRSTHSLCCRIILLNTTPMMKQSSRRSKDVLKGSLDPRKPITDYQDYEQQLASYQQSGKGGGISDLFDWSKPSEIVVLKQQRPQQPSQPSQLAPKEEPIQNNSMNTEQLLRSEGEKREEEYLDDSFEVEPAGRPSFVERVQQDYGGEYRNMSCGQIDSELKTMREEMLAMDGRLNRLLDRYELMAQPIQKEVVIGNPHLFLTREVEINARILNTQAEEIRHIQEKERALQKKDYLVELNELIIEIGKEIHDTGKEKHSRWVDVERIDRLLRELEDVQGTEEEYRQVKDLKLKIVYYFKKLKEQKMQEEELDLEIEKLALKHTQLARQFQQYTQLAVQKSLEVTTNKKYLDLKKKYQQLVVNREDARRKKDITAKFQLVAEEKVEREMQAMRKELQRVEMQAQQAQYKSAGLEEETADLIKKHSVPTREIKSISYRFDESLLHGQAFKPNFKRASRMEGGKDNNKTIQEPTEKTSVRLINDKNLTIDETSSNAEQSALRDSKLKPMLRQWKGKSEKGRYLESPSGKEFKTLQSSNIFRPPLMLRSKK